MRFRGKTEKSGGGYQGFEIPSEIIVLKKHWPPNPPKNVVKNLLTRFSDHISL